MTSGHLRGLLWICFHILVGGYMSGGWEWHSDIPLYYIIILPFSNQIHFTACQSARVGYKTTWRVAQRGGPSRACGSTVPLRNRCN
jgi:hypothetical protein